MAIVFGGDTGLREDGFQNFLTGITNQFNTLLDGISQLTTLEKQAGVFLRQRPKENVYVDDGFQNVPGTSFTNSANLSSFDDIQTRRVTTQAPDLTVYIKKRLFWSLRNEHDIKFMDEGEKLFMRASKLLFERKCSQIAAYEAVTKMNRLIQEDSEFDAGIIEILANSLQDFLDNDIASLEEDAEIAIATDPTNTTFTQEINSQLNRLKQDANKARETIEALRNLMKDVRKTRNAINTTWVVDPDETDRTGTGRGAGVIELTLIDSLSTGLSLEYGDLGSFNFTVENPYNLLTINANEVELALRTAYTDSKFAVDPASSLGPQQILEQARRKDEELRRERNERLNDIALNISNPLSSTDISEITFEVNASSTAAYKVTARVGGISEPFHKDNFRIVLAQALDPQIALTFEEDELVRDIFRLLELYVTRVARISLNIEPAENSDVEYARRQLRKFYLGKSIIQPMDGVNIYIRGNTFDDRELVGPLNAFLNLSPFVQSFGDLAKDELLLEEMRQFGLDDVGISVDLYRSIRTSSLLRNAGAHVFGGLVSNVTESYNASSGKYTLAISGESNMKWLDLSRVNIVPSLDQAQGVLEDPLTPLEFEVDPATGLVDGTPNLSAENRRRLASSCLYYTNGVFEGQRAKEDNVGQDVKVVGGTAHTVRQHAPGLKYRWKEGVIAATRDVNLRTALNGRRSDVAQLRRDVGVTVVKDAFANLDIADVISLLVVGQPHNYETFVLNASSVGTFSSGRGNNPETFFDSFIDITRSTNRALGNFQPMKDIQISRAQMAKRLDKQTDITQANNEVRDLQKRVAQLQDQLNLMSPPSEATGNTNANDPGATNKASTSNSVKADLDKAVADLSDKTAELTKQIKEGFTNGLRIYGDDIILDSGGTEASESDKTAKADKNSRMRSKFLQMRPQLATKFNSDQNLFVVSDDYDKDLDLQAFTINLASGEFSIWESTYKNPRDICVNAAKVIDFEFFCDTQGNLRFRPPKYNKLPLSLLVKMILLTEQKNIDLASPFVKSLFGSREQSLIEAAQILELEIQTIGLLLNINVDRYLNRSQAESNTNNRGQINDIFVASLVDGLASSSLNENVAQQVQQNRNKIAALSGALSVSDSEDDINSIQQEITSLQDPKVTNVNTNRLSKFNQLLQLASRKQRVDETIQKIKDRRDSLTSNIVDNPSIGFGSALNSGQVASLTEPFGDLIEDDYNDFLGPGSSKRFIINDDKIISYEFKESDQNVYCRVDVTGQEDLLGESPGDIGGIPLIWAGATDFDLWKQYGWREGGTHNKPFFKSGSLQCAPYALMLLSRQRRDTVRATMTLTGNEFYQLGDVVYINSKDLLYYVYGIRHSISPATGAFTTTLDLRYGHPLGDFIPTPLDVIGKNLIKNQRKFNTTFMNRRTAGTDIGRCVGVVLFSTSSELTEDEALHQMLEGELGIQNLNELKNSLLRINSQKSRPNFDKVEIRGFTGKSKTSLSDDAIRARMVAVRRWLRDPIAGFTDDDKSVQLRREDFPAIEPSIIRDFNNENDPVDLSLDEQTPANRKRTPREESYSLSPECPENIIEIVIVFKES